MVYTNQIYLNLRYELIYENWSIYHVIVMVYHVVHSYINIYICKYIAHIPQHPKSIHWAHVLGIISGTLDPFSVEWVGSIVYEWIPIYIYTIVDYS